MELARIIALRGCLSCGKAFHVCEVGDLAQAHLCPKYEWLGHCAERLERLRRATWLVPLGLAAAGTGFALLRALAAF